MNFRNLPTLSEQFRTTWKRHGKLRAMGGDLLYYYRVGFPGLCESPRWILSARHVSPPAGDSSFHMPFFTVRFLLLLALALFAPLVRAQTLNIANDIQTYATLASTTATLTGKSELRITGTTAPITGSVIHLNSPDSWFVMTGIRPSVLNSTYLPQVRVSGAVAVNGTNCRVVQYGNGAVVIPHAPTFSPLTVYSGKLFTGTAMSLTPYTAYGTTQLGALNDNISSFKLKRGYMATLAQNSAGTGVSRCYVAQDGDLDVSVIQSNLDDQVSFVRVFPWRWVSKKGIAGNIGSNLNIRWWYNWNLDQNSTLDKEYVAIRQTRWWPGLAQNWQTRGINHLLGYNEPDHADQANMSIADAIAGWPDLLGTGLRVGSPAPTDGGLGGWLYPFITQATAADLRVDFVAVHYYRSFSNPADPAGAANQFYNFLKGVHDTTGKPVWVTEFNNGANWTGDPDPSSAQQAATVQAMVDMLESTPWVERYSIYNWVEDVRRVEWDDGWPTAAGENYRDKVSSLSYWQDIPSSPLPATALYRFETTANDNAGHGHIAVMKGAAKYAAGKTGQGLSLSGSATSQDYVQLSKKIGDSTSFTFGAWVYWSGGGNWQRIFDLGKDTENTMFLTPSSSAGAVRFGIEVGGVQQQLNHTAALPLNTWTHVAVTITGSTGKLFINGALVATNAAMTHDPVSIGTEFNYLGKSQFNDPYFNGRLDDVTFLPTALSDAQVAAMQTNNPPAFSTQVITGATATQGVAYSGTIAGQATDPDAGNTITYTKLTGPAWLTVSTAGVLGGTPPAEEEGVHEFVVAATDSRGLAATAVLNITLPNILGDGTWTANASGSWGDTTKWAASFPANGATNTADFSTLNIAADTTVTLDRTRSIGGLIFGDTSGAQNWTLTSAGSALTLENGTASPVVRVDENTTTIALPLDGSYGITKDGAATLVLSGDNSLTGPLNVDTNSGSSDDGVLRIANPDAITGITAIAIRNNNSGRSRLELDGTARDIISAAPITLSARSTANATTAIRSIAGNNVLSGTLTLGVGGANYIIQSDAGVLTFDGNITSTSGGTRLLTFNGTGGFFIGGEIRDDTASATVFSLTKNGTGALTLQDKDNTMSGHIIVNGGTLTGISSASFNFGNAPTKGPFGNPSAARTITVNNGGTLIFGTGNCFGGGGNTTAPTPVITIAAGGVLKTAAPPATTPGSGGGDANIFGPITLAGGTFTTGNGFSPAYQSAILMSNVTTTGTALINTDATNLTANGLMLGKTGGGTITFDITGSLTIAAPLTNSPVTGTGALTKTGTGTLTLTAASTYTGPTLINTGTLALNGSLSSPLTIAAGTTFTGTGSNTGTTSIAGSHYPGSPVGVQSLSGALTYGATSRLRWLVNANNANAASRVNANAVTVTAGAALDLVFNVSSTVNFTDLFWKEPRTWTAIAHTSRTGTFTLGNISTDSGGRALAAYGTFALVQTPTAVTLNYTPILTPLETWQQAHFGANWTNPAIAGDLADPDGDGIPNLLERAFAGNPNAADPATLPTADATAPVISIIYRKANAATDLTFTVLESATLPAATWPPATGTPTVLSDNGTYQTIRFTAPAAGAPGKFLRVQVAKP